MHGATIDKIVSSMRGSRLSALASLLVLSVGSVS
jgi:hypothetical protein